MPGTQFISNPFQVLGVSDPDPKPEPTNAPVAPASPSVATALPVAPLHAPKIDEVAPVVHPAPKEHLSFLHHLGTFFLDSVLPIVLQVGVPILEKEI